MKNKNLWVGYLTMPDKKKTLVASDDRVETGKSSTIFLYNQERDKIVEYSREIIAAKLQDAPEADYDAAKMTKAYKKALRDRVPNLYRIIFSAKAGIHAPTKEKKTADVADDDDLEIDDSIVIDDDDTNDDDDFDESNDFNDDGDFDEDK